MGLLSYLMGGGRVGAATPENPRFSLNDPQAWDALGADPASTGVRVTRDSALTHAPWWRAVNLLAGDVAKLPVFVYRRTGQGKERAADHPAYQLLRRKPNPYQTAYHFKLQLTGHALSCGNGYAYILRRGDGVPLELWPLDPEATYPVRADGRVWYVTKVDGEDRKLPYEDVLHVKGLGYDGLTGYSLIEKARESIGLGMAQRKYTAVYYKNGARASVVLQTPNKLNKEAVQTLREGWERMHAGLDNAHRTAVLDNGLAANPISFNAEDSELIASRQFEIREIASFVGLPPHKLGDTSRTAYASLEQENLSYLTESLDPRLVMWEEEAWDKLLSEGEKAGDTHAVEFQRAALVRADLAARGAYYATALGGAPWMMRNEVRGLENLNPVDGGDDIIDPLNMAAPGKPGEQQGPAPDQPPAKPAKAEASPPAPDLRGPVREVLAEALGRMARRVGTHARRAAADPAKYLAWLDEFRPEHAGVAAEALAPGSALASALAGREIDPRQPADALLAGLHLGLSRLADAHPASRLAGAVDQYMTDMEQTLPVATARQLLPDEEPNP